MDGLMFDSENVTFKAMVKTCEELGVELTLPTYTRFLGRTAPVVKEMLKEIYGKDFPSDDFFVTVHRRMNESYEQEIPIKKGLLELLNYAKEHHYTTVVASSSALSRIQDMLDKAHISSYFDDIMSGDFVVHSKPEPEIFLKACEKAHCLPHEAIVLEDSQAGIEAAYRANIPCICIPDLKYPEESYAKKCWKILDSLLDVIDELKK